MKAGWSISEKLTKRRTAIAVILVALMLLSTTISANAYIPGPGTQVAIVPDPHSSNGGTLPTTDVAFVNFTFTDLPWANVTAGNLTGYQIVVLVIDSAYSGLSAQQVTDLNAWVNSGGKLIIYDSEMSAIDYSWLIYPFTTNNAGGIGGTGELTCLEDADLGSSNPASPYYINITQQGANLWEDAVGDANVFVTQDIHWCGHLEATNANNVTGWVHTYAVYGDGLMIYNGFDIDNLIAAMTPGTFGIDNLAKVWLLELARATAIQNPMTDEEKQQDLLTMANNHRGLMPAELVLAVIRNEGGIGAFHIDGWNYNSFYREIDGPWAQPTNGDGIMQVTQASGYHQRSGLYTNDQEGNDHVINDGCDYLLDLHNAYGSYVQTVLHYNTGPSSLYIYLGRDWGDRDYLGHVAEHTSSFVLSTYGLQNEFLVNLLYNGQNVLNDYLYNKGLLSGQSVSYYLPYQEQLDNDLNRIDLATKATELAKSIIGTKYQFGAGGYCYDRKTFVLREDIILNGYGWNWNAPTQYGTGLDCSGLIFWSYNRAAGVVTYSASLLPRNANGQYEETQPISRTDLRPGDLLFFDAYRNSRTGGYTLPGQDGHVDHVAMYAGEYQYSGSILGKVYSGTYNIVEASGIGAVIPGTVDTIIARIQGAYGQNAFVGFGRVREASALVKMQFVGNSPIDLSVTDPDGFTVTKTADEAGDLFYREFDLDGDGELEDVVYTWEQKLGDYVISVVPEAGAALNDTYTIEILADNATVIVAQNVSISDIPNQPYIITSNETTLIPRLDPHDIGITQLITSKIVVGQNFLLPSNTSIFNYGNNTESFDVTACANTTAITAFTNITLACRNSTTLSFLWNTTGFTYGDYTISVYAEPVLDETYVTDNNYSCPIAVHLGVPGDVSSSASGVYDMKVDMKDIAYLVILFNTRPNSPNWNPNADVDNNGVVSMIDIAIAILNFNKHE